MDTLRDLLLTLAEEMPLDQDPGPGSSSRLRGHAQVRDIRGCTLIHIAVQYHHVDICQLLLNYSKDVRLKIQHLGESGDVRRLKWIELVFNVNVNARDARGWSVVALAVFHHNTKCLKLLLDSGADPHLANQYGLTTFDLAQPTKDAAGKTYVSHDEELQVLKDWVQSKERSLLPNVELDSSNTTSTPKIVKKKKKKKKIPHNKSLK